MLSKFFPSLKPKEYSVQVLRDSTSQSAVKRIKRNRTKAPYKKIAALALALSFIGGGLVSATAATAVTSKQAQANILSDNLCLRADAKNSGSWNGGGNVYGVIGGRPQQALLKITKDSNPNDVARNGKTGSWIDGRFDAKTSAAPAYVNGEYLTAYEKYSMSYPIYDAWRPVSTDNGKDAIIKQVDTSKSSYDVAGKLPTKGAGDKVQVGSSALVTTDMGACLAFMPTVTAAISNFISTLPRLAMYISIELYTTAYGSSLSSPDSVLYDLGKSIDKFITAPGSGLKDVLFVAFMIPLLLIGALYVAYVGIIKRGVTQALQSTGWMILSIALGSVFLAQPLLISNFVDSGVSEVQGIVNEAVTDGSRSTEMCALPPNSYKESVRETKCTLWHSTIYSPWVAGQFGENASSASAGSSFLTQEAKGRDILANKDDGTYHIYYGSKNSQPAESWPQFMVDRQATTKTLELSEVAFAQLSGAENLNGGGRLPVNNAWAGSIDMISSSILMFFGAGASSAVLFVYGFSLLIYQLMMISAVLMSPFFFLFGIVPNWGRKVLMRYAELLTSLFVKRVLTATMLSFYLLFYNLIIGGAETGLLGGALIIKLILGAALALFFIGQRGKFIKMFADNINFGGNKSIGLPGNRAVAATAGITAGILGGGLIGGAIVGHKTRKANKDTEHSMKDMRIEGNPTADIKAAPKGGQSAGGNAAKTATRVATNAGTKVVTNKIKDGIKDSLADKASDTVANAAQNASKARTGATPTPTPNAAPTGMPTPPTMPVPPAGGGASSSAGAASSAGGAGATVAPGISAAGAAGGAGATGAAAAGSAGISAAGAAGVAAGGVAGGGAAAAAAGGGSVAAGAAAGSVVPVVGTIAGAAAGAAIVAVANKKKADAEKSNGQ